MSYGKFRRIIWHYYRRHGRHDLPWRKTKDPYRLVVSEVMLQQTQVSRVIKFYKHFIKRFPGFRALSHAKTAAVLQAWQGLGYNRRALALQKLSRIVSERFNRRLPRGRDALESLPGIGKGTAGAIRAFAWNEPEVFVETNIRRVFIHFFFPRRRKVTDEEIKRYIQRTLPRKNARVWYWALMDYGARLGAESAKNARSERGRAGAVNPNRKSAHYKRQPVFFGSDRELRGKMLRLFLGRKKILLRVLAREMGESVERTRRITNALVKEGFVKKSGIKWETKLQLVS